MMSVAWPRMLGPDHLHARPPPRPAATTPRDVEPLLAQAGERAAHGVAEVAGLLAGDVRHPRPGDDRRRRAGRPSASVVRSSPLPSPVGAVVPSSLMPPPPAAWSGSPRSRRRSGSVSRSSSWVPTPTISPSSRTTIWSALMMVETRWADDHDGGVDGPRRQGRPEPGVGGEVEGGERVVEDVDLGLADERPGDREALALAARHVGAALGDVGVEPAHRRARSRRPGRPRAPPTSPRRWRPRGRSAGCWRPCR